ncbi:hypothetical protein [Streptomyces goshikiensis]|uniref:hypothetical protein n=1 Tax=Streptomyces goshikiensis TaxID=1942 RepID=UPI0037190246
MTDPTGLPALTYHAAGGPDGTSTDYRIDLTAPTDLRERAICRALLQHALALLDASEPAQPNRSSR